MLKKIADTIRSLTMDAVEKAGSGHPGLPMGCAELGAFLFAEFLRYNPSHPKWKNRDRLILSAGHGSLWLYTCLHLVGYSISIEDLKQFRQFGSKTPSHPDVIKTVGIEATTGVDGQGVGFAVGQALALKIQGLASKVVVLAGDGCLMEGISYESCSLAGHLNLNNLIVIYDSNRTTLVLPVIGTFLAFADYMRSAIRMTCLMRLKVIYHFTHDSIFVGHDGPTHQPIEQLSSLRGIPGLLVIRPADSYEVKMAWIAALEYEGPTALILSRQPLPELNHNNSIEDALKGAYIIKREEADSVEYLLLATGSEVQLALEVARELGAAARVVSMPSWELFEKQSKDYKEALLKGHLKVSIEAGIEQGWHKYIGSNGIAIALSEFGECGSITDLQKHFGYTTKLVLNKIMQSKVELCASL